MSPSGASTSSQMTATLLVSEGRALQVRGGDTFAPSHVYLRSRSPPSISTGESTRMGSSSKAGFVLGIHRKVHKAFRLPRHNCRTAAKPNCTDLLTTSTAVPTRRHFVGPALDCTCGRRLISGVMGGRGLAPFVLLE